MFDYNEFKKELKTVLRNWSEDDLDAMLAWMIEDKEEFKRLVDLYVDSSINCFELQSFLDKP